jgi:transposase
MRRLAPLLPSDTRGKPQVDDRRVISAIVHVLRSGCPWRHAPREYGPPKTLYNRYVRWAIKGVWRCISETLAATGGPPAEVMLDATYAKAHRSASGGKGGERAQAIGRSRGGRAPKIHTSANQGGKPIAFHLSGGNTADLRGGELLIEAVPEGALVIADRAFDADRFRRAIEARSAVPNIPPSSLSDSCRA